MIYVGRILLTTQPFSLDIFTCFFWPMNSIPLYVFSFASPLKGMVKRKLLFVPVLGGGEPHANIKILQTDFLDLKQIIGKFLITLHLSIPLRVNGFFSRAVL